jgi:hypothetical protein
MLDGIITRAQAEASSDSSSDDDDDDTDYLKEIYGYGGSLIPSAPSSATISVSAISKQHSKTGGASVAEQQKITINHANEFERRAREITIASKMKSSSSSSSSSSNNNSSSSSNTTATTNNNDKNTHNTKSSSNKKKKAADRINNGGAIMDYAWDDNDKKKTVSIYITLPGLDNVIDDDIYISLINDNRGIYFTVKNIIATTVGASTGGSTNNKNTSPTSTTTAATTTRFLKIDKLYSKVTNVKLIRKIGQNKVIIKLTKDTTTTTTSSTTTTAPTTTTTKWYTLQEGGSHTIIGHDWYDDSDDDDWTPQEDEAAVNDFLNNL